MGMFDNILCEYPLPVDGVQDLDYQTKSTPNQTLTNYKIDKDGVLWEQVFDVVDNSIIGNWERDNPSKPKPNLGSQDIEEYLRVTEGCMDRTNERWVKLDDFTDSIDFYSNIRPFSLYRDSGWVEFRATFENGVLTEMETIEYRKDDSDE